MTLQFNEIGLVGKYQEEGTATPVEVLSGVADMVTQAGCRLVLEESTARHSCLTQYPSLPIEDIGRQCDACLVVGGDGTMLGVSQELAEYDVPLIGINQGRLGFVTDLPLQNYHQALTDILHGEYKEDVRHIIQASIERDGKEIYRNLAMNDVVVNRGSTSGMVELRMTVDGQFVASHRADGLIVCSATGSTAYALSAGGPIVHPGVACLSVVPIAPHNLNNRPIVLPYDCTVVIEMVSDRPAGAYFDVDGFEDLQKGDRIVVTNAQYTATFLHPKTWSYFSTLRQKLHWNAGGAF